jgi:protein-tyrosine phosphatase
LVLATTHHKHAGPTPRQIAQAVDHLKAGRLIIMPTETVYGVAAMAGIPAALEALRALPRPGQTPRPAGQPFTWHAPRAERVASAMDVRFPLHLRCLDQLAPGPVRFLFPKGPAAPAISARLGVAPGSIDAGGEFGVRVPDAVVARAVLEDAGGVVVAERISAFGLGDGRTLPDDIGARAMTLGIAMVLDDGPTRLGKPATTLRLLGDGSYDVVTEETFEARYIRQKIERRILFVCTGNTCRSPMAEAITRHMLGRPSKTQVPTVVESAGTSTRDGMPISDEARRTLAEMGIDATKHRSQEITLELIDAADEIFALTREHAAGVLEISPSARRKVKLLDPAGKDIPDPIGGPIEDYRKTAARIKDMVSRRLEELDRAPLPAAAEGARP